MEQKPFHEETCVFNNLVDNKHCIVHNSQQFEGSIRCELNHYKIKAGYARQTEEGMNILFHAKEIILKKIYEARGEVAVLGVSIGIIDDVFNSSLIDAVEEFRAGDVMSPIGFELYKIKDRLSELDKGEDGEGHDQDWRDDMEKRRKAGEFR
jgi:hypothetical protein